MTIITYNMMKFKNTFLIMYFFNRIVTFSSVTHLSLHIPGNIGGEDITKVYYIGFKGEFTKMHRHGVTLTNYESTPQMSDYKDKAFDSVGRPVM